MADPAIPREYLDEILAFLRAGKTGQVTLHVAQGQVKGVDFTVQLRQRDIVPSR